MLKNTKMEYVFFFLIFLKMLIWKDLDWWSFLKNDEFCSLLWSKMNVTPGRQVLGGDWFPLSIPVAMCIFHMPSKIFLLRI